MQPVWLSIPPDRLAEFCRKWRIVELSLFGSVLRDDFSPDSDVDVLVTFDPAIRPSIVDLLDAREELERLLHRHVDLIEKPVLERHHNPWLRHAILSQARTVYRAA